MKTTVIENKKDNATNQNSTTEKPAIRPSLPLKDSTKADTKEQPKAESKEAPVKEVSQENPKVEAPKLAEQKSENGIAELKAELQQHKPALNLDSTIKFALELNRRINQRGKLLETIGTLEEFEVFQKDDAYETESNHFQRCELTIEDDKGREFTTKNPFIINAVAKMVNTLCVDKLAEIESEIQFPDK